MAGVFRVGVVGAVNRTSKPLAKAVIPALMQSAGISGKIMRATQNLVRPKPFPYKEKQYGFIAAVFDKTTPRFDENSKVICVEGPIAAGKTAFGKELADDLDMLYVPAPTFDEVYVNPYGFDMRTLDPQLPVDCRSFDTKSFCLTPNGRNCAQFQIRNMIMRYSSYVDSLAHVLSTGQGVVTNRSPYSDYVFLEAMYKHGYISKGARSVYYDLRGQTITEILQPHLVIYLDVPVSKVKENIKKRNIDYEMKSKVFTDEYLADIESLYKQRFLKEISQHAELLVYDWSNGGDAEVVVEDIERIDFDRFDHYDPKQKDWRYANEWEWCEMRMRFTYEKPDLMNYFSVPRFDVPELTTQPEDAKKRNDIFGAAPGMKYRYGYNKDMGDTGIMTKTEMKGYNISD